MSVWMSFLLVGVGGFIGALARFLVSHGSTIMLGSRFPFGTLVVNVSGSFLLGLLYGLVAARAALPNPPRPCAWPWAWDFWGWSRCSPRSSSTRTFC